MHCRGGVSLLMVFALVFGVLLVSCPAFAVQGGFSRPYTHYADDEDLTVILTNFARSQGLGASFSPGVVGKVSGRFDAVPPETFLKGMQAAFGVTWYRLGSTLYFYSESELSRTFITPRAMTAERLYQMQAIGGVRPATARDARPRRRDDRRVRPAHLPCPDFSRRHRL